MSNFSWESGRGWSSSGSSCGGGSGVSLLALVACHPAASGRTCKYSCPYVRKTRLILPFCCRTVRVNCTMAVDQVTLRVHTERAGKHQPQCHQWRGWRAPREIGDAAVWLWEPLPSCSEHPLICEILKSATMIISVLIPIVFPCLFLPTSHLFMALIQCYNYSAPFVSLQRERTEVSISPNKIYSPKWDAMLE